MSRRARGWARTGAAGLVAAGLLSSCGHGARAALGSAPAASTPRGAAAPGSAAPSVSTTAVPPPTTTPPPTAPTTIAPTTTAPTTTVRLPPRRRPRSSPLVGLDDAFPGQLADTTVGVYDRSTGQTWLFHPDLREDTASIVKLQILAALLYNDQVHGLTSDEETQALMTSMIEDSDNDAATTLWDQEGAAPGIAAFDRLAGLDETVPSATEFVPGTTLPGWGLTTTSAADQVRLVRLLAFDNPLLTTASRTVGLGLMEQVESGQNWGVSAGPGPGSIVALKNGWLPLSGDTDWQVDSVGWVRGGGRDYVLAVLTGHDPTEQQGIDLIQAISDRVYQHL